MIKGTTTIGKGQSYWLDLDEDEKNPGFFKDYNGELQKSYRIMKKRPWLVISSDDANMYSGIVTVVPISLSPDDYEKKGKFRPYHVQVQDNRGRILTIKTEQMRSIDKRKINPEDTVVHLNDAAVKLVDQAVINYITGNKKYYSTEEVMNIIASASSYDKKFLYNRR